MSFNKNIVFTDPPKNIKVGFIGPPPLEQSEADGLVDQAYQRGKKEASEFYKSEVLQLRQSYAVRQDTLLSSINHKSQQLIEQLDSGLPGIVMAVVERILGECPMTRDTIERLVKSMISEFANEDEKLEIYLSTEDLNLLKSVESVDSGKEEPQNEDNEQGFASAIAGIFDGIEGEDELLEGYPNVKFFEDSSLSSGDCQIKSRFGLLDGRISTKLRKVERELKNND